MTLDISASILGMQAYLIDSVTPLKPYFANSKYLCQKGLDLLLPGATSSHYKTTRHG